MRRKILLILVFLVSFILVGCDRDNGDEKEVSFYQYLVDTQNEYSESQSGNIKLTIINDEVTTELEYVYNYNGTVIRSMKAVLVEGDTKIEAYVKDGYAYVNANGVKSKTKFFDDEGKRIIEEYGFDPLTSPFFATFDESLFAAFTIDSNKDGEAQLTWDPSKYVFLGDDLKDEEWIEADKRFRAIKENITEITMTIKHEDEMITLLDSHWKDKDNVESQIKIEFRGTDTQNITYPSDLNEYE